MAATTIGLFKTEAVGLGSPFRPGPLRTLDDVEYPTMEWVDWYNNRRQHSDLDYVPPAEHETPYYAQPRTSPAGDVSNMKPASNPERFITTATPV